MHRGEESRQVDLRMEQTSVTVVKKIQEIGARCTEVLLVQEAKEDASSRVSLEVVGEVVLLMGIAAFFGYMFVESLNWGKGAALLPRIIILLGLPFWVLRIMAIARQSRPKSSAQIMDTGFYIDQDPRAALAGFIRISGFIVLLYLGIWLFGFHVALPVGMFFYLYIYGKMGWFGSALAGLIFLAIIVGVYDYVLRFHWDTPVILRLISSR